MRQVIAVIVGYALWTGVWLGGGAGLRQAWPELDLANRVESAPALAALLGLSVLCSVLAGLATRRLAGTSGAVIVMAILLLATGIGVQASIWEMMPMWYHVAFLLLLVPMASLGGRLGAGAVK